MRTFSATSGAVLVMSIVSSTSCGVPAAAPRGGGGDRHVECVDPRHRRVGDARNSGWLCGREVERLGFQNGVSEDACARLGGHLERGSCVVTTRFVDVARPAQPGQPGFFCQGKRDERVIITTSFFDMTSPAPADPDEPAVAAIVVGYWWEVSGAEVCRLGNPDHDIEEGVVGSLDGSEQGLMTVQLERLHDAAWNRLLGGDRTAVRWRCVLHPDDPA